MANAEESDLIWRSDGPPKHFPSITFWCTIVSSVQAEDMGERCTAVARLARTTTKWNRP
jgi:hypothetical protein